MKEWVEQQCSCTSLTSRGEPFMHVAIVGLDIAKHVFQLHGSDAHGKVVLRRKLRRHEVVTFFANLPSCTVGLEACGGAHYWARRLTAVGHTVRLMAPQFVKPFVKSNKNDANDAEAICEAVARPSMRFVPPKSVEQQDIQLLHRVRSRLCGCAHANCEPSPWSADGIRDH